METPRIFVCEDDGALRGSLVRGLREEGYDAQGAERGRALLELLSDDPGSPSACVIDIGLPDCDGRDLCQAIRSRGLNVPVLFLTAKTALADRLAGFAAGGDDYLGKPFAFAELLARLNALLRRGLQGAGSSTFSLDPTTHALVMGSESLYLTPTEYRLLACLAGAHDGAASRLTLIRTAWPAGAQVAENTLDSYMTRLRHKLGAAVDAPQIMTLRGAGYRLT